MIGVECQSRTWHPAVMVITWLFLLTIFAGVITGFFMIWPSPIRVGRRNARNRRNRRVCKFCRAPVNFYADLYVDAWCHAHCLDRQNAIAAENNVCP